MSATAAPSFLNPELSLLAFQERVLALAESADTPLGERLRFLAIVSSNLDEFYMVRMAGLRAGARKRGGTHGEDGQTRPQQLAEITARLADITARQARCLAACLGELAAAGLRLRTWRELTDAQRAEMREMFRDEHYAALTPMAMTSSPGHPLPRLQHHTLSLAVVFRRADDGKLHYAEVELPRDTPRFLRVPFAESPDLIALEDVMRGNLDLLYPHEQIENAYVFRVTRAAELALDEENAEDLLDAVAAATQQRPYNPAVRLEVERGMPPRLRELLIEDLSREKAPGSGPAPVIDLSLVQEIDGMVDLRSLHDLPLPPNPALHYRSLAAREVVPRGRPMREAIAERDLLVHHPFEDFAGSVVRFLREAALDPAVAAIKITLYRVGNPSPVIDALLDAAARGKSVVAFVELKARFDEESNVTWARALEDAGGRVVYGLVGLKNHAKVALVVRRENDQLRRYVHVGTGNYNARSGAQYTDLSLFTCDIALADDASALFNYLTGSSHPPRELKSGALVAPRQLLPAMLDLIEREAAHARAGRPAGMTCKLNGLSDPEVVRALYAASGAGVPIDLVVRGLCTLRPGVKKQSEHIRVISVVGRFLEHSRIYRFHNGGSPEYFIGSADLRSRNLRRRVELLVPVRDADNRARLDEILAGYLEDETAWDLGPDGTYTRRAGRAGAQDRFGDYDAVPSLRRPSGSARVRG